MVISLTLILSTHKKNSKFLFSYFEVMKSQEILKSQANPHERALAPKDCCGWKHLEFGIFDGHVLLQWQLCSLSFFSLGNGLDFPLESWLVVADEGNNWRFSMGLLGCDWRLCLLIPVWLTFASFSFFSLLVQLAFNVKNRHQYS